MRDDANDLAVTVRFMPPLADGVKRIAGEEGSPFTAVIRHAVGEYVARRSAGEQRVLA
jgi:predicted transcriptional regulator